jgi:mitochondrial distribution and morphology protein 31
VTSATTVPGRVPKALARSSSMSFQSHALVRALSRNITHSVGTSASHKISPSTSERYNAIRKFFKQQATASTSKITPNLTTYTASIAYARPRTAFRKPISLISVRPLIRHFHASSPPPRQQTTGENPSQKQSHSSSELPQASSKPETSAETSSLSNRFDNYPRFFRRLALSIPNIHRPTRDDLLSVASGFWQRTRIRFRWFTIKSFRKFNADDISAFITWFLMSQTLWILVGT